MGEVAFRVADVRDTPAIEAVMKASAHTLSRGFYEAWQIPSVERFIATLDPVLIEDGTYFVGDVDGRIVCCGGWSRRDKLFTGVGDRAGGVRFLDPARDPARVRAMFVHPDYARRGLGRAILALCEAAARAERFQRLELMATLPGEPLYAACGFRVVERVTITLPDGVEVGGARMEKPL
jgi:GNAT superfamily N-acetyltransferase